MSSETTPQLNVIVHPLVLLSVVDHFHRVIGHHHVTMSSSTTDQQRHKRVMGVLLGQVSPLAHHVNVSNSYACKYTLCSPSRSPFLIACLSSTI